MKGITPVIAIILLLLITISMVGFAFVWFQRVAQTATSTTDTQLQEQLGQTTQKIAIDNIDDTNNYVYVRNTGTTAIATSKISIYVNGVKQAATWESAITSLSVGDIKYAVLSAFDCSTDPTIKVKAPGNEDSMTC